MNFASLSRRLERIFGKESKILDSKNLGLWGRDENGLLKAQSWRKDHIIQEVKGLVSSAKY